MCRGLDHQDEDAPDEDEEGADGKEGAVEEPHTDAVVDNASTTATAGRGRQGSARTEMALAQLRDGGGRRGFSLPAPSRAGDAPRRKEASKSGEEDDDDVSGAEAVDPESAVATDTAVVVHAADAEEMLCFACPAKSSDRLENRVWEFDFGEGAC